MSRFYQPAGILRAFADLDERLRGSELVLVAERRGPEIEFTDAALGAGWSQYTGNGGDAGAAGASNPVGYQLDHTGIVWLRGVVTATAGRSAVIFTLPGECCPPYREIHATTIKAPGVSAVTGRVDITPAGAVTLVGGPDACEYVTLDNHSFMVL